jgi:hypothetical protein
MSYVLRVAKVVANGPNTGLLLAAVVALSDDDVDYLYNRIAPLELQDRGQPFIDGALQTRR